MNLETLGAQGFEETESLKQLRHRGLRKDEQISDFSKVCRTFAGHLRDIDEMFIGLYRDVYFAATSPTYNK